MCLTSPLVYEILGEKNDISFIFVTTAYSSEQRIKWKQVVKRCQKYERLEAMNPSFPKATLSNCAFVSTHIAQKV